MGILTTTTPTSNEERLDTWQRITKFFPGDGFWFFSGQIRPRIKINLATKVNSSRVWDVINDLAAAFSRIGEFAASFLGWLLILAGCYLLYLLG